MKVVIRKESSADHQTVFDIVELAFRTMPFADGDEQFLVENLRKSKAFIPELSLVAEVGNRIVGHIMFTPLQVVNGDTVFNSLCLAPVSVHPDYQKRGIGSGLIEEGHRIAKDLGFNSCFVVGHADYYPRFGYITAAKWHIPPPHGVPPEAFMATELITDALKGVTGVVRFLPEFGVA